MKVNCFLVGLLLAMACPPAWAHSIPRNTAEPPDASVPIGEDTILSVPSRTPPIECAVFMLEGGNIRRTANGVRPSSELGTLIHGGMEWADCGPLASYRWLAIDDSATTLYIWWLRPEPKR